MSIIDTAVKVGQIGNITALGCEKYAANDKTDVGAKYGAFGAALLVAVLGVVTGMSPETTIPVLMTLAVPVGLNVGGVVKHAWDQRREKKAAAEKARIHREMVEFGEAIKVSIPHPPADPSSLPPIDDNSRCVAWIDDEDTKRACTKNWALLGTLKRLGAVYAVLDDGRTWTKT